MLAPGYGSPRKVGRRVQRYHFVESVREEGAGQTVVILEQHGDYFERVGLLRVLHYRLVSESGDGVLMAYVDQSGKLLDFVSIGTRPILWFKRAEQRTIILA